MNSIETASLNSQTRVFVRCDLDVPVENGLVTEEFRLESILPTLKFIKEKGARLIIGGHMAEHQSTKILGPFFDDNLGAGNYELLENLRFSPGEKENDLKFAKELAQKADIYVNESFATSHRKHTSIVTLPTLIPAYAGLRLIQEVRALTQVLENPSHPLITIVGGVKIESKMPVISKFLQISEAVLLGGKLGVQWKDSIPNNLFIPKDYNNDLDIGPQTIAGYRQIVSTAKTVIWAGPLGMYQEEEYIRGTKNVAEAVIESGAYSLIGGGDTTAAFHKLNLLDKVSFASTGGGAMLDFLATGTLPGLEALGYHA